MKGSPSPVDKGKFFLMEDCQLINVEGIMEGENHSLASPN